MSEEKIKTNKEKQIETEKFKNAIILSYGTNTISLYSSEQSMNELATLCSEIFATLEQIKIMKNKQDAIRGVL